jgi:hypothetical protein
MIHCIKAILLFGYIWAFLLKTIYILNAGKIAGFQQLVYPYDSVCIFLCEF